MDPSDAHHLLLAVDSCSQDVVSANPYWSMTDTQRSEWKDYTRARLQQQDRQQQGEHEYDGDGDDDDCDGDDGDCDGDDNDGDDDSEPTTPTTTTTAATKTTSTTDDHPQPKKEDRRKLWVTYQSFAREELRQETGKQKIPLTTVNARARSHWVSDGWAR